ncbi:MAG TPA: asparagine synthase (glutamine-hydrolyzing) [Thermoanaerobaculia bacterium]
MCGIVAIFAYHSAAPPVDRDELQRINTRMLTRGPDAQGVWFSGDSRIGLGSRRLAIIDLSDDATQPMQDGELTIVFNGEIYNYAELRAQLQRQGTRFRTTSDTEVLLHLFRRDGERMVELLRGMYAFAIWDAEARRMFVARDPYGIKPFFYADDGKTIRLASQVKALLAGGAISRTPSAAGAAGFFLTGSVPEPFTVVDGIRAVEAGTSFWIDERGRHGERRFYSLARVLRDANEARTIAALTEPATMLHERVEESIRYHLVADVPVAIFLSAGIDSTSIAALATRVSAEPLHTFTLQFPELDAAQDEAPDAERFARHLVTRHMTRVVTRREFLDEMPRIFEAMDQPTIDGVNTYFVSKAAREAGVKVALSGVGGDELFGSYPSFRDVPRIVRMARLARGAPRAFGTLARARSSNPKMTAIPAYGATYGGAYLVKRGLFMPDELPAVLGSEAAEEGLRVLDFLGRARAVLDPDPRTPFGRVATLEASLYMRNQLLRDSDWASMAHSVEVRTPLVDAALVRQLAPLLLQREAECKQDLARVLPPWLREHRKRGFFVPLKEWMELPPDGTTTRMRSWAKIVMENVG